jgi:trigger factor
MRSLNMKKFKSMLHIILVVVLTLALLAGCSGSKNKFSYSDGIDSNGFWKNVKALNYVEMCDYANISVPENIHTVPDETVQAEIDYMLNSKVARKQVTDRAIVDGDTVNIDFVGSIDGVEFEGGSTGGIGTDVTIGVTSYIDDFLEQLIGHSPGESFNIEVTFPENYQKEELQGKDAVFAITVNYIVESVLPELTDDFVRENFSASKGWSTVAQMREDIANTLQNDAVGQYLQEYVIENTKVASVPKKILKYLENSLIFELENFAAQDGMELDDYLKTYMNVSSTDELIEIYKDQNMENAEFFLIIQAIAEDAGIGVTDDDVAAFFKEDVGIEDYSEQEEHFGMPYLKLVILHQAVFEHLVDNAVIE